MQRTDPFVQLADPSVASVLYWWVKEDDLVLYPDFVDNRLKHHVTFQELRSSELVSPATLQSELEKTYSLFLDTFVPASLVGDVSQRQRRPVPIVRSVEFRAPHLDDMCKSLEQDAFDLLVEFRDPVVKVGVTLQVQPINLRVMHERYAYKLRRYKRTAAWILPRRSENASAVYEHVDSSSTARMMSLNRSITLFVLS